MACAGMGTRLGLGCTKALVQVCGRPLIHWNLAMIPPDQNLVCVVGFQADLVIDAVLKTRPRATFAFNRRFATTGTAASLALGCRGLSGEIVSLDGDLLVHPADFKRFQANKNDCIGVCEPATTNPVYVSCKIGEESKMATAFTRERKSENLQEWTGLVKTSAQTVQNAAALGRGDGHVFQMIEPYMPLEAVFVQCREVDTPEDHREAEKWLAPIQSAWGFENAKIG
jgi:choline kinase